MCRFIHVEKDLLLPAQRTVSLSLFLWIRLAVEVCGDVGDVIYPCKCFVLQKKTEFAENMALCLLAVRAVFSQIKDDKCFCLLGFFAILKFEIFNCFNLTMNTVCL